jgi:ABC-2 type transport system ATP-binding protein
VVPSGPPVIRTQHLTHRFGSVEVLHDISFEVARGEIFGFIGPNGAGKTTTIRAMTTLLEPTSGRIEIDGVDVALEPERVRRKIGYMADQAGVYAKLSVEEYLTFFAAAYGLDATKAAGLALDLTGLGQVRALLTGTLSKGMKQRLQLAKTLLHDPELLILDEPASDLDPRARIEMRDLFLRLRQANKTIFLSSHILTELSDVCTSIGVIEKGRLLAYGPISEVTRGMHAGPGGLSADAPPSAGAAPPGAPPAPALAVRSFKLRTLGSADQARSLLEGTPGIAVAHATSDQLLLRVEAGDAALAEAVKRLVVAGVGVIGLEPERDQLETMFLQLTKKDEP